MLFKLKRFSNTQIVYEAEDGTLLEPVESQFRYFKLLSGPCRGIYMEAMASVLSKKELTKALKARAPAKVCDPSIARDILDRYFQTVVPSEEADLSKWPETVSKLLDLFSSSYADAQHLDVLARWLTKENFVEFLTFSDRKFAALSVQELIEEQQACQKRETECWSFSTLKSTFHFSDSLIRKLLPEPILADNPHYRSAAPMKLYRKKAVAQAMESEEYQQYQKKRAKRAAKREQTLLREQQIQKAREETWQQTLTRLKLQDFYSDARAMKRHFILHLGPTNSGKTHEALQDFRTHENSIYLAPLRLLAQEVAENTNAAGVPCSMQTGEERSIAAGATHYSQTIELLDLHRAYEVAVIDEAQMMEDRQRGGAWTEAVLGVCAKRIHICAPPYARNELIRLVELCGDSYEIVEHSRLIPLSYAGSRKKYQKGDALIVFSRRAVYEKAKELQSQGYSVSILYGAMPYEAKKYEAQQFQSGKTELLVATDCIGMGMNLPIQTVCFLEHKKYDGLDFRDLYPKEVQQIAGRAGRYGLYPNGYYVGSGPIKTACQSVIPDTITARVRFPETIGQLEGKLSQILAFWQKNISYDGFCKQDCKELIEKVEMLEKKLHLKDNQMLLKYACVPLDLEDGRQVEYWIECVRADLCQSYVCDPCDIFFPEEEDTLLELEIAGLERMHRLYDIYCHFVVENDVLLDEALKTKQALSQEISRQIEHSVRSRPKNKKKKDRRQSQQTAQKQ